MKTAYSFRVLRYVHDPVTQEFINIGVAVYAPEKAFLKAICATHYGRITRTFTKIDGNRFRQLTRYIQDQVNEQGSKLNQLAFEPPGAINQVLVRVLPPDDSALQFSPAAVGLSMDLEKTTKELFERYVNRYAAGSEPARRDDEDVWRTTFREALLRKDVHVALAPKRIVAPDYEYEFQHAWKNGEWHLYEPVSFDMVDGGSIVDKANRWVGRGMSLNDSAERFQIHLLLGEPQDQNLRGAFLKAENILRKMPGTPELVRESEAEAFAEGLAEEVREHEKAS